MKLENQVCSLELAQKLKELGVKQESYFSWVISKSNKDEDIIQLRKTDIGIHNNLLYKMYHAYSVAELGEMLPRSILDKDGKNVFLSYTKSTDGGNHGFTGFNSHNVVVIEMITAHTEADARAKMLIYLLENKLI